jgi:hypothetical protein
MVITALGNVTGIVKPMTSPSTRRCSGNNQHHIVAGRM